VAFVLCVEVVIHRVHIPGASFANTWWQAAQTRVEASSSPTGLWMPLRRVCCSTIMFQLTTFKLSDDNTEQHMLLFLGDRL